MRYTTYDVEEPIAHTRLQAGQKEDSMDQNNEYVKVEIEPLTPDTRVERLLNVFRGNSKTKRHTMLIPEVVFHQLQYIADAQNTNVQQLIRQFLKLGIIAERASEIDPDAMLYLRIKDQYIPLVLLS